MSYCKTCITARDILHEHMSYRNMCLAGRHISREDRFYWRICFRGGHVLQETFVRREHVYSPLHASATLAIC